MKVKQIFTQSSYYKVQFLKGNYEDAGYIFTETDDISKIRLPDDVNMIIIDDPSGQSTSYLIGEIVYANEKGDYYKQTYSPDFHGSHTQSWLKLYNGPTINYGARTNIISPQKLGLSSSNQIRHIAYTIEYPHTEGYIKKFYLKNHNLKEVKITDDILKTANFIELYDLTPNNEKTNAELFAIGVPLTLSEVEKLNKTIFTYMKKHKITEAFMDSTQKVFPIVEKNVKILNPNTFNSEGYYDPDNRSYLELD